MIDFAKRKIEIRAASRKSYAKLHEQVLTHLGGRCADPDCGWINEDGTMGCADPTCLQVDHVNGNGCQEIKHTGRRAYLHLILNDAEGRYQLLCANCNWKKRHKLKECRKLST